MNSLSIYGTKQTCVYLKTLWKNVVKQMKKLKLLFEKHFFSRQSKHVLIQVFMWKEICDMLK